MQGRAGLFTGSGMPMRFADTDGTMVDVYQATTQMTDQSGQTYPDAINALLDRALGPEGFYGAFTANMHADQPPDLGSDAIIASAQARGVPVVSGHQMLEWLDGRNASAFQSLNWDGHILTFTISVGHGANGLRAMIPTTSSAGALTGIRFNGAAIYYPTQVIKGVEYALVSAGAGQYEAMYGIDNTPPFIMNVSALPISGSSAIVTWDTNELADSRVDYGVSPAALNLNATNTLAVTTHIITLTALTPETTYYYRVTSVDPSGNSSTSPDAGSPLSFTTPLASLVDTTFDHFSAGMSMTNIYIGLTTDGQFMITPTVGAEFSGVNLPAGWTAEEYNGPGSGGSAVVSGGSVTLDGMRLRTDALYGPGRSIEFVATFRPGPYQDVGFGVDLMTGGWATFSTADTGESLWASTAQTGSPTPPNTNLGSSYLGAPHRYRIDWNATNVVFWIDGTRVATHTVTISTSMRPIAGEYDTGGQVLNVDWMHMSPYTNTASFTSRVLDGGNVSQWLNLDWAGSQPTSTSVHFETRSGSTATPDGSWSPWAAVNSPITSPDGRYIQYRATLSTTDPYVSPAVEAVSIGYRQTPTAVPASLHFYGTVRVGAKTPMGTIVSAWINGVKYAETTVTLNGVNTVYDLDVPGDDSDTTEIEGGRTGDTVYFRIGDKPAHQTAQWPWMEPLFGWQTVKLDLTGDQLHLIYLSVIIR
jgi:hypothetical protein